MRNSAQKRFWLRVCGECNNNCLFCLDRERRGAGFRSVPEIVSDLKTARKKGFKRIVISGGEASIHPDFIKVVAAAKKTGFTHIQTITNGRRFAYPDFFYAAQRAGLSEITFSLHSHKAKVHDGLTGAPGSFAQGVAALRRALAENIIVSVDLVINSRNVGTLRETLDFFISLGVREFDLLQIIPFGAAWANRKKLLYDPAREISALHHALELSRLDDVRVWTNRLAPRYLEGFENLIQNPAKLHDEVRGELGIFPAFLYKGKKPCCMGARCKYCFLQNLCADILILRRDGVLPSLPAPSCLGGGKKKPVEFLLKNKSGDAGLDAFVDFYIKHRYFVKGKVCLKCALSGNCSGANIAHIIKNGFASLKPPAGI